MIDQFTTEDLERLISHREENLISIFIPTERASDTIQQNPIRLKNAAREAMNKLEAQSFDDEAAETHLRPVLDLVQDHRFWQYQSQGLAVFVHANGSLETYRLPIPFEADVFVLDRFAIKPLLPLLTGDGHFYILTLSQDDVRLLQATRYTVDEINLDGDLPDSLKTMLRIEDVGGWRSARFRAVGVIPGAGTPSAVGSKEGGSEAIHSASYVIEEDIKQRILEFFRLVNKAVMNILPNEQDVPLVLAGVEYLPPIYHEANTYRGLFEDDQVTGSPKTLTPEDLRDAAWEIVEPLFKQKRQERYEAYQALEPRNQATGDVREIVPAAYFERVDVLWVASDAKAWGTFDADSGEVEIQDEARPANQDLLDFAAVHSLINSGEVYAVSQENVPDTSKAAAILRY